MSLSQDDRRRIAEAIRAVEEKTSGEIVCVLARLSADATALPVFLAAALALALPWPLVAFTELSVYRILSLQVIAFMAAFAVVCLPRVRVALMPRRARRAVAHRVAMEQFRSRGIAQKKDRCGILIFVSEAERYARIIADEGIAARVPQADWQQAVDALIVHAREGRMADGFITAINLCGEKLVAHFPRDGRAADELPDRVYVI